MLVFQFVERNLARFLRVSCEDKNLTGEPVGVCFKIAGNAAPATTARQRGE
jgi:hypothetical protein